MFRPMSIPIVTEVKGEKVKKVKKVNKVKKVKSEQYANKGF